MKGFNAIKNCGTKELGYHICTCEECNEKYFGYSYCRNRYCPMCQNYARENGLGAKVNIASIPHTCGQTMEFHPHINSIVIGVGLKNNHLVSCNKNYLF